jgi:hypothetical protein
MYLHLSRFFFFYLLLCQFNYLSKKILYPVLLFSSYYHLNINAMSLSKMTFELIAFCYCCSASLIESHLTWSKCEYARFTFTEREARLINVKWQACSCFWFLFIFFSLAKAFVVPPRQTDRSMFAQSIGEEARAGAFSYILSCFIKSD